MTSHLLRASRTIQTADELDDALCVLNEEGATPTFIGFDRNDVPFLAYGWAPGGDGWDTGVVVDDPYSYEFDRDGVTRCEECNSEGRLPLGILAYPVRVIGKPATS